MQIGIDFGTCFSIIAFTERKNNPTIPGNYQNGIPSTFMYSQTQKKYLFGNECDIGESIFDPADVIRHIKKKVRENPDNLDYPPLKTGGKEFSIRYILENYLDYLIGFCLTVAEESAEISEPLDAVTITVPVGISSGRMMSTDYRLLLQNTVMKLTGLPADKVYVLEEPVAAALSYCFVKERRKRVDKTQKVLVFDLGGGTCDTSIVEYNSFSNECFVKASEGDLNLGGNDWDDALANDIMRKYGLTEFSDDNERASFIKAMNDLKHKLSRKTSESVNFKYKGRTFVVEDYTRKEFEAATKHLLDKAMALVHKTVSSYSSQGIQAIDKIVLVGGSCNMPQVVDRLKQEFPQKTTEIRLFDPSGAIARGAAIHASLMQDIGVVDRIVNQITSKTYGFSSFNSGLNKQMIFNMIYKDTPFKDKDTIENSSGKAFTPLNDDQAQATFIVYESENVKGTGPHADWSDFNHGERPNGLVVSVDIPAEYENKATQYALYPTFTLDKNGIFNLIIRDKDGRIVSKKRNV